MPKYKVFEITEQSLRNMEYHCSLEIPRESECVKLYDKERNESYIYDVVHVCHETSTANDDEQQPTFAGEVYVANPRTPKDSVAKICENAR